MSSTTVARGNAHETFYIGPTLTPTALTTSSVSSLQTFAIPGLLASDFAMLMQFNGNQTSNIAVTNVDVPSANNLIMQFQNISGSATAITPASGTYVFQVVRSEGPLPTNAA
jgi:hypothetical protein